ncbi:carbohydrate kinase family protein, partial [Streptomyces sp. NPDC050211]
LAGLARQLPWDAAARLGCVLAAQALAAAGPQTYRIDPQHLLHTAEQAYGAEAAGQLAPALSQPAAGGRP